MSHELTKEEAMQELGEFVMALQGGSKDDVRLCVKSLCQLLSGEEPDIEDLRNFIDADF